MNTTAEDKLVSSEITKAYKKVIGKSSKPKILICTPEVTELPEGMGNAAHMISAKGGGLGDISASLIRYLNETDDFELHVVLPKYDSKIKKVADITNQQIDRLAIVLSGEGIHLVNDSAFSYISNPYQDHKVHTGMRRALAFQRYIINNLLDWIQPDVVHCNDWMTGLVPAAAKSKGIKSLFTLHNIFTQHQTLKDIELSGMKPLEFAQYLYFEKFPGNIANNWKNQFDTNNIDFTASAILACDYFNTVSETFLDELKNNYFDEIVPTSIYHMIKEKYDQGKALGITNAPNDTINSKLLPHIINFNKHNIMEIKARNKEKFQELMGLPTIPKVPVFFWPNRLYYQKAPDLVIENAIKFVKKYNMQIAVVANGDNIYEEKFKQLSRQNKSIAYRPFSESLSDLGKAASDFLLMPSRYEPCGLPQMEGPRFGTLPIVRATGGLKDTIDHLNLEHSQGNGFSFEIGDSKGLEFGIIEALNFYKQPFEIRKKTLQRVMSEAKQKYNLKNTAQKYIEVYNKMIKG